MLNTYIILCLSAAAGGAVNSIAGGGTLLTFPALFAALAAIAQATGTGTADDAAVWANATSTVALFPGSLAALAGYRRELQETKRWAWLLCWPSILGGLLGAWLVVELPAKSFALLVPWLILTAALLFSLQPFIARWAGIGEAHVPATRRTMALVIAFQLLVAVYGGYFGAGIGILMLSSLAMMGLGDIHRMNALKSLLATLINGSAVVMFCVHNDVYWPFAIAMAVSSIVGGYCGARVARRLNKQVVRGIVIAIGFCLASYYFYRQMA